jgi:DNA-binding MarR family transcriptional regulator
MTRLVRALEEEGLVRREADARDGRIVRLRATSKGESLLAAGRTRRVRKLSEPLAALTAAEQSTLQEAAEILSGVIRRLS